PKPRPQESKLEILCASLNEVHIGCIGLELDNVQSLDKAVQGFLGQGITFIANLLQHLSGSFRTCFQNAVRELRNCSDTVLLDQHFKCPWVVGSEVRCDLVIFSLAHITDQCLQILGKFLIFFLVNHKLCCKTRLNKTCCVV